MGPAEKLSEEVSDVFSVNAAEGGGGWGGGGCCFRVT